jgi:hypothetical protein
MSEIMALVGFLALLALLIPRLREQTSGDSSTSKPDLPGMSALPSKFGISKVGS